MKVVKLGGKIGVESTYSDSLPAFLDCQKDSESTGENRTQVKPVLLAVEIFAVWRGNEILLVATICLSFWNSEHVVLKLNIHSSALPRSAAVCLGFWNSDHVVWKSLSFFHEKIWSHFHSIRHREMKIETYMCRKLNSEDGNPKTQKLYYRYHSDNGQNSIDVKYSRFWFVVNKFFPSPLIANYLEPNWIWHIIGAPVLTTCNNHLEL